MAFDGFSRFSEQEEGADQSLKIKVEFFQKQEALCQRFSAKSVRAR
jgi:hypothetical protein